MSHHDHCDDVELLAIAALSVTDGVVSFRNRGGFKSTVTRSDDGVYILTLRDAHHSDHLVIQVSRNSADNGTIQAVPGEGKTDQINVFAFDSDGDPADTDFSITVTHSK